MVDNFSRRKHLGLPDNGGRFAAARRDDAEITLDLPQNTVDELSRTVLDLHPDAQSWTVRERGADRIIEVVFPDGTTTDVGGDGNRHAGDFPQHPVSLDPYRNDLNRSSRGSPPDWTSDIAASLHRTRPDLTTVTFSTVGKPGGFFWSTDGIGVDVDGNIHDVDLSKFAAQLDGPGRSRTLKADDQMLIDLRPGG